MCYMNRFISVLSHFSVLKNKEVLLTYAQTEVLVLEVIIVPVSSNDQPDSDYS